MASVEQLNNDAAERALNHAGLDITGIDSSTLQAVQDAVHDALYEGWTDARLARTINRVVGLSKRDAAAVAAFQQGLVARGATMAKAQREADAYAARLKKRRAQVIAEHEVRKMLADAQREAWADEQSKGVLTPWAVRVFRVHKDERLCKTCRPLNGRRISIGATDPAPPLHPNCRCWEELKDEGVVKGTTKADEKEVVAKAVRRVRTPEGARYFNLPIGSPIVPGTGGGGGKKVHHLYGVVNPEELDTDQKVEDYIARFGLVPGGTKFRVTEKTNDGTTFTWGKTWVPKSSADSHQSNMFYEEMQRMLTGQNEVTIEVVDSTAKVPDYPDEYAYYSAVGGVWRRDAEAMARGLMPVYNLRTGNTLLTDYTDLDIDSKVAFLTPYKVGPDDERVSVTTARLRGALNDLMGGAADTDDPNWIIVLRAPGGEAGGEFKVVAPMTKDGKKKLVDEALRRPDSRYYLTIGAVDDSENLRALEQHVEAVRSLHQPDPEYDEEGYDDRYGETSTVMGFTFVRDSWSGLMLDPDDHSDVVDQFTFSHGGLHTDDITIEADSDGFQVEGAIYDEEGDVVGNFTRFLYVHEKRVYNSYLSIGKDHRDNGFARAFNQAMFDWYTARGFETVDLSANIDVGGYAWARQGFDWSGDGVPWSVRDQLISMTHSPNIELAAEAKALFDRVEQVGEHVSAYEISEFGRALWEAGKIDPDRDIPAAYKDGVRVKDNEHGVFDVVDVFEGRVMEYVRSFWPGKNMLLGSSWHGYLSLTEYDEARKVYGNEWKQGLKEKRIKKDTVVPLTGGALFVLHGIWEARHYDPAMHDDAKVLRDDSVYGMHVVDVEATKEMMADWDAMIGGTVVVAKDKVRTPAGSRRYLLPIGATIVADPDVRGLKSIKKMLTADPQRFHAAFSDTFANNRYKNHVSWYSASDLAKMKCFVTPDGKTGVAIKDHGDGRIEATALFSRHDAPKGQGQAVLKWTVRNHGVNYVECYGWFLQKLYRALGFRVGERYEFDEELAADDWDYNEFDNPDYFIMPLKEKRVRKDDDDYVIDYQKVWDDAIAEMEDDYLARWGHTLVNQYKAALVCFGDPEPTDDEIPGDVAKASPPRDADNDGWIYEGTPRKRPAPPHVSAAAAAATARLAARREKTKHKKHQELTPDQIAAQAKAKEKSSPIPAKIIDRDGRVVVGAKRAPMKVRKEAWGIAVEKVRNAPQPTPAEVEANHRILSKPGGRISRGKSRDRLPAVKKLFKEFGGEERGYIPCWDCGVKLHWDRDNHPDMLFIERDKIVTGWEGGRYRHTNTLPCCYACNSSRRDEEITFAQPKWKD